MRSYPDGEITGKAELRPRHGHGEDSSLAEQDPAPHLELEDPRSRCLPANKPQEGKGFLDFTDLPTSSALDSLRLPGEEDALRCQDPVGPWRGHPAVSLHNWPQVGKDIFQKILPWLFIQRGLSEFLPHAAHQRETLLSISFR